MQRSFLMKMPMYLMESWYKFLEILWIENVRIRKLLIVTNLVDFVYIYDVQYAYITSFHKNMFLKIQVTWIAMYTCVPSYKYHVPCGIVDANIDFLIFFYNIVGKIATKDSFSLLSSLHSLFLLYLFLFSFYYIACCW